MTFYPFTVLLQTDPLLQTYPLPFTLLLQKDPLLQTDNYSLLQHDIFNYHYLLHIYSLLNIDPLLQTYPLPFYSKETLYSIMTLYRLLITTI